MKKASYPSLPNMQKAFKLAQKAFDLNEVPVGAVLVETNSGEMIASAHNNMHGGANPLLHAEMQVIAQATQLLKRERLDNFDLYVTLEPCPMCAAAISFARINTLYFGAYDPKGGAVEHNGCYFDQKHCFHKPEIIGGLMEEECAILMKDFFKKKRHI